MVLQSRPWNISILLVSRLCQEWRQLANEFNLRVGSDPSTGSVLCRFITGILEAVHIQSEQCYVRTGREQKITRLFQTAEHGSFLPWFSLYQDKKPRIAWTFRSILHNRQDIYSSTRPRCQTQWAANNSLICSNLYGLIEESALVWMQVGNREDKIMVCLNMV